MVKEGSALFFLLLRFCYEMPLIFILHQECYLPCTVKKFDFHKKKRLLIACFVQKLSWIYVCFISSSLTDPWLHIAYVSFSYMWSVMRYYMLVYAVSFIYADAFIQGCLFICIIYFCCVDLPLEKWRFLTGICHGTDDLC